MPWRDLNTSIESRNRSLNLIRQIVQAQPISDAVGVLWETAPVKMSHGLASAIDGLYDVFSVYPRPKWFLGCVCCWGEGAPCESGPFSRGTARVTAPGGSRPLRQLSAAELGDVALQVPHLGGDVDVLRHYLPRVLEIAVADGFDGRDFDEIVRHISFGPGLRGTCFTEWPAAEQTALHCFFHELWATRLDQPPLHSCEEPSADTLLCGIGAIGVDLTPCLERWESFCDRAAARQLHSFLEWNSDLPNGRLANGFWGDGSSRGAANVRRVVRWAHARSTRLAVLDAADRSVSVEEADALGDCLDLLAGDDAFAPTSLEAAVASGDTARIQQLLADGTDPNECDNVLGTPIWQLAFIDGHAPIAKLLVNSGAAINAVDRGAETMLHRVVGATLDDEPVRWLLDLGADPNLAGRMGFTPLHSAAAAGNIAAVRLLIAAGASTSATTRHNKRAADIAADYGGHPAVTALLHSHSHP